MPAAPHRASLRSPSSPMLSATLSTPTPSGNPTLAPPPPLKLLLRSSLPTSMLLWTSAARSKPLFQTTMLHPPILSRPANLSSFSNAPSRCGRPPDSSGLVLKASAPLSSPAAWPGVSNVCVKRSRCCCSSWWHSAGAKLRSPVQFRARGIALTSRR